MEIAIGQEFTLTDGRRVKVVENTFNGGCNFCAFKTEDCSHNVCCGEMRKDKKYIIYLPIGVEKSDKFTELMRRRKILLDAVGVINKHIAEIESNFPRDTTERYKNSQKVEK